MTDTPPVKSSKISPDWFVRGALTKAGDALDRLLGRNWKPSSSLATSELIERIKRLLDSEAQEVPGKGLVVPHEIKLKVEWDKFATDTDEFMTRLETELLIATADHINDSLYYTFAPISISVEPDYFVKGVQLTASFGSHGGEAAERDLNVTLTGIDLGHLAAEPPREEAVTGSVACIVRAKVGTTSKETRLELVPGQSVSIGRAAANAVVLDDKSVSKIHASLSIGADGDLLLADTGSTNGTFLNGKRIAYGKAVKITEQDKIAFGDVEVVLERSQPAEENAEGPTPLDDSIKDGGATE